MPSDSLPPSEVTSIELVEVRLKSEHTGQRREYNYVVQVSTADAETGEPVLVNEYRVYASDTQLSNEVVLERMTALLEEGLSL